MTTEVIIAVNDPTPIAYLNLYEHGDRWEKVKGCDGCTEIEKCCGNCPMLSSKGCFFHLEKRTYSSKPFKCVVAPMPNIAQSWCQLEYKCVKGKNKEKIRRSRDKRDVLI